MFAFLRGTRKLWTAVTASIALIGLASCSGDFSPTPQIDSSRPVPVALLVPGGGSNAVENAMARSLENAARLAMSDLDGVTIDLKVYNTAADADTAAAMAKQAVRDGAKIILGPVYSQNATAVGAAAPSVNVLSFSNNPAVAGGNVFVLGNTFQNTARRLVTYAAAQGKGDIMIVNGDSPTENVGRDAIAQAIASTPGATQTGNMSFAVSQTGVINAVRDISIQARNSGSNSIFLTSGTDGALSFLAQLLPENGLTPDRIQYIGLQRWDIPASARTLPGLQNGWFALPDPALQDQFTQRYVAAYGENPHSIAGLAYDGIAAIGALAKSGNADALSGAALTQPQGFVGVNGVFRLRADGTAERALAVMQIIDKEPVVIAPAARSFAVAGY
ncbi:MAG: penicillin-binding protein activator [Maritimibacter sp.]